jgi:hypothetical protein
VLNGFNFIDSVNLSTNETELNVSKNSGKNLIKSFKNKLPLILMTLNPKHEYFYPDEDLLESGLLFAVLLRKLSMMLENPRIDNLILTEIWLEIANMAVDKNRPETFYLYAF